MPIDWSAIIPENTQKALLEAFGNLAEKLAAVTSPGDKVDEPKPKAIYVDPDGLIDAFGMGYRENPSPITADALRNAGDFVNIVNAIILLRKNQAASFTVRRPNRYSIGFEVKLRGRQRGRMSAEERSKADSIERFISNTGLDHNISRDSFETFIKKVVRDRYELDATCFEKWRTRGGRLHSFNAVDGGTIRRVFDKKNPGIPLSQEEIKTKICYAQVRNGVKEREFTMDELAYLVANPRTDIASYGYGLSEVEMLVQTITWLLWAQEYNARGFSQGTTAKGILAVGGRMSEEQMQMLQKRWLLQLQGIMNAWKTPVINSEKVQWIPLQQSNKEMEYQLWLEFLTKCAAGVFLCDPAEVNFDLRGGVSQQPTFMSNNEAQQKISKDRGLSPLLRFLAEGLNRHVVWPIDERFELFFGGLDAETEQQAAELRSKQVQSHYKLDEVRDLDDLEPMPDGLGQIVLNPVLLGYMQMKQMAAQAQAAQGQEASKPPEPQVGPDGQPIDPGPQSTEDDFAPAGPEERMGARRLLESSARPESPKPKFDFEEALFEDDWTNTIHSSLKPAAPSARLEKSLPKKSEIFVFDLD